jgi:hypothetical protein
MSPIQQFASRRPGDRGGSSGRPLLRRPGLLAREAPDRLSPSRALRLRFASPQKSPDELRSKNSCGEKAEETFQSPLLAGTFTKTMKAGTLSIKPNCIVYIIQLQRADKENFVWPGRELKLSIGRSGGAAAAQPGKRLRRATCDCSTSQRDCLWSEGLTVHPLMRSRRRPA